MCFNIYFTNITVIHLYIGFNLCFWEETTLEDFNPIFDIISSFICFIFTNSLSSFLLAIFSWFKSYSNLVSYVCLVSLESQLDMITVSPSSWSSTAIRLTISLSFLPALETSLLGLFWYFERMTVLLLSKRSSFVLWNLFDWYSWGLFK